MYLSGSFVRFRAPGIAGGIEGEGGSAPGLCTDRSEFPSITVAMGVTIGLQSKRFHLHSSPETKNIPDANYRPERAPPPPRGGDSEF